MQEIFWYYRDQKSGPNMKTGKLFDAKNGVKNDAWHGIGLSYFRLIDAMWGIVFWRHVWRQKLVHFHHGNGLFVLIVLQKPDNHILFFPTPLRSWLMPHLHWRHWVMQCVTSQNIWTYIFLNKRIVLHCCLYMLLHNIECVANATW